MSNYHVPIHADSARERPLEEPKPGLIVVDAEKLIEAVRVVHLTGVQS